MYSMLADQMYTP